jgi:ATP-dependent 26S proteasome regulatory subunit
MEAYDGMAILATNFRQNLDQAFARRLHATIEFPFPQASDRERIWRQLLPSDVPQADDVNFSFLAGQFALAGGNIKNCVLAAAFAAAADGGMVTMGHLVQAVTRELEKMDQPIVRSDFGAYYELARA